MVLSPPPIIGLRGRRVRVERRAFDRSVPLQGLLNPPSKETTHRLRGCIASMASALRGLDALVFTGGVGEHSSQVRAQACAGLEFLGVRLDENLNSSTSPDAVVSPARSQVATFVVAAREDLEIARQVRGVLAAAPEPGH
jgi:acetate kinase